METMKARMRWMLPVLCAVLSAAALPVTPLAAQGPIIVMVNPYQNGQQVRTLRNTELSPILGTLNSPNGVNRVTVYVKRQSDGYYWNGLGWVAVSTALTATISNRNPTPPFYDFRVDVGPSAAAITASEQYTMLINAYDLTGALSSVTLTLVGID